MGWNYFEMRGKFCIKSTEPDGAAPLLRGLHSSAIPREPSWRWWVRLRRVNAKQTKPICTGLVCFVIKSERRKILKRRELSVKMKIRKGAICRYTGALGLEVLDRRYVFAPEAAMKQAMDWYKERI